MTGNRRQQLGGYQSLLSSLFISSNFQMDTVQPTGSGSVMLGRRETGGNVRNKEAIKVHGTVKHGLE